MDPFDMPHYCTCVDSREGAEEALSTKLYEMVMKVISQIFLGAGTKWAVFTFPRSDFLPILSGMLSVKIKIIKILV